MAAALPIEAESASAIPGFTRKFDFERDRFLFPNELFWEYRFDESANKMRFVQRDPKPAYAHHCFVMARSARQFLFHARFEAGQAMAGDEECRRLIRKVVSRNPRVPSAPGGEVLIPGFSGLAEFSRHRERLLKEECGGAWQSYVLRSHWRMVFPISRRHQERTARSLASALERSVSPIVHAVTFPALTINHGLILFDFEAADTGWRFRAYDPNDPEKPAILFYDAGRQTFFLPANHYWAGGELNIIEIYKSWLM